ncbi:FliM/FliN family flagellar motor C-terminal domain-containing protein [Silvibacterium acidisoli]|uniref:FliM/FliN family flagellar motor C-terminal domain-containing protein n=1 Tax=Acidobacteriaceae bacterium ZG23-2 TaxID=2883246 RepID=UPI00406C4237
MAETIVSPAASASEPNPASAGVPDPAAVQLLHLRNDPPVAKPLTLAHDSLLARLPVQLDATVPVPSFRVQDLLSLEPGTVLESRWVHSEDIPVWCGGVQLIWAEFEVVEQKLAVRVTRIS